MCIHPYIASQLISDRQRAMIAAAEQHRLARQLRTPATPWRPARWFAQRLSRPLRTATAHPTEITA
jgi:hypothetical protein